MFSTPSVPFVGAECDIAEREDKITMSSLHRTRPRGPMYGGSSLTLAAPVVCQATQKKANGIDSAHCYWLDPEGVLAR